MYNRGGGGRAYHKQFTACVRPCEPSLNHKTRTTRGLQIIDSELSENLHNTKANTKRESIIVHKNVFLMYSGE